MLKLLMAALGALMLFWIGGEAASAHETRQGPATTERERREAQTLTERLRQRSSGVGIASSDADLVNVAGQRQALLESLARSAPRMVLTLALTPAERAALPAAAQAKVEQPATSSGRLRVLHTDRADGSGVYDMHLVDGSRERAVAFGV